MRRWNARTALACSVAALGLTRTAAADTYEATLSVRPIGGTARFTEDVAMGGQGLAASTYRGGLAAGLAYGVRNWLDVGGELVAASFSEASYDSAMVTITGVPTVGRLTRTSRLAQLRAGATLRLGVGWVPTLYLGMGGNARLPSDAALQGAGQTSRTPNNLSATVLFDLAVIGRIGFEHRLDRRWSVGFSIEAVRTAGFGGPPVDMLSAGISGAYTWYPGW